MFGQIIPRWKAEDKHFISNITVVLHKLYSYLTDLINVSEKNQRDNNRRLVKLRLSSIEMWLVQDSFLTAYKFLFGLDEQVSPDVFPVSASLSKYTDLLQVLGTFAMSDEKPRKGVENPSIDKEFMDFF